jgi:hypothetical protein
VLIITSTAPSRFAPIQAWIAVRQLGAITATKSPVPTPAARSVPAIARAAARHWAKVCVPSPSVVTNGRSGVSTTRASSARGSVQRCGSSSGSGVTRSTAS